MLVVAFPIIYLMQQQLGAADSHAITLADNRSISNNLAKTPPISKRLSNTTHAVGRSASDAAIASLKAIRRHADSQGLSSQYSLDDVSIKKVIDFNQEINAFKPSVIAYFAPWCPHCQHFIPKFVQFADENTDKFDVTFGTVDCVAFRKLCGEMKINFYPTLVLRHFEKGMFPLLFSSSSPRCLHE
jgi:thiol-disulfide isomerase/thioredoxin